MNGWLFLIPVIAALFGWLTNRLLLKMLFHPLNPIKILGVTVQGIFPKRQKEFAEKLGRLVSKEFLSFEEMESKLSHPQQLSQVMPMIAQHVDEFLRNKMSGEMPFLSMFIGEKTIESLKTMFLQEIGLFFPRVMKQFAENMKNEIDLENIVTKKLTTFSAGKLEKILYQTLSKEFRFVELMGAVVGFLTGLLLVGIAFITS